MAAVWDITPAVGVFWNAGAWSIPMNVTTANSSLSIINVSICRIDSSFALQQTLGSTTFATSLGTTGVKTFSMTTVAGANAAGDIVVILLDCLNSAMTTNSFAFDSSQVIVSPFDTVDTSVFLTPDRKHSVRVQSIINR